jgi:hypothetical protein
MGLDLWSADYYEQKAWTRFQQAREVPFEPWEEARERYIVEKIEPTLQMYRQSDHNWFKDFSRRRGEVLHSSDLILKLQRLNAHIVVQQQVNFPDDWGLYSSALGRIQFLTGLPKGWLTEWSYALVDDRDLPTEERRGWRTVLVYLMFKGALSWEQVIREFGEPQDSFNDARWQEATADFRLGGDQMVQRNISNLLEP